MMIFENYRKKVQGFFIMLGSACNLHCRYCLQQCQEIPALPSKVNAGVIESLRICAQKNPIWINFYGGEPTLYYTQIKQIVEATKDLYQQERISYSIISNGKAITPEIVQFFNKYNFSVTISWDGYNSSKTRLYDVFEEKGDTLFQIKNLAVSGVLSSHNYPLDWCHAVDNLNQEYRSIHGYDLEINIDYIFDTGIADKQLIEDMDYNRLKKEMSLIGKAVVNKNMSFSETARYWGSTIGKKILCHYKSTSTNEYVESAPCSNGYSIINMDLAGNLYECHNVFTPISNIKSDPNKYLDMVFEKDNCSHIKTKCQGCIAFSICRGGCKLLNEKQKISYCKIRKVICEGFVSGIKKRTR